MSSSKGNINRTRAQKHQNRTAFKNDLHDKGVKMKFINSIQLYGICTRCKDIIDWKRKYRKYKPLTAPKKCVRCELKSVKHAYHTICLPCSRKEGICAKCLKPEEVIEQPKTQAEDEEMKSIIKALPERKRRTLLRYLRKQSEDPKKKRKKAGASDDAATEDVVKPDYTDKINKLKLDAQKEDIEDYGSDFCDSESDLSDNSDVEDGDDASDDEHDDDSAHEITERIKTIG